MYMNFETTTTKCNPQAFYYVRGRIIRISRLEAELIKSQQALTQSRDEMVTMVKHQRVVKQLKSTSATENETFAELSRAQGKVKKV
jgi:hypothetical protein